MSKGRIDKLLVASRRIPAGDESRRSSILQLARASASRSRRSMRARQPIEIMEASGYNATWLAEHHFLLRASARSSFRAAHLLFDSRSELSPRSDSSTQTA